MKITFKFFILFCLFLSPYCFGGENAAFHFQDIKNQIEELKKKLLNSEEAAERSRLHFELAKAYHRDQDIDAAFRHFLLALQGVKPQGAYIAKEEEQKIYEKAVQEYISLAGTDPMFASRNILEHYGKIAEENPNYLLLNFLVSTAFANVGQYENFFDRFYRSYPFLHESFLAYKTQGILLLRLASRMSHEEEKNHIREEAFQNLTKALEKNLHDCSLYKVLIFLAKEEENEALISTYLHKICENKVQIPRADVYLYVREAVSCRDYELAQNLINHARTLYEFSRLISEAEDYLNQNRGT